MILQPQLKALLRDGSQDAQRHDTRNLQRSWREFAAFAYVAEQYGYQYDGLSPISPKGSPNPYFAFRRTPDPADAPPAPPNGTPPRSRAARCPAW